MRVVFNPENASLECIDDGIKPHGVLMSLSLDEPRKLQNLKGLQCQILVEIDGHDPITSTANSLISTCETILCSARIDWPPETNVKITVTLSAPDVLLTESLEFVTPKTDYKED